MEKLIYTVSNENGLLEAIFSEEIYAQTYLLNHGKPSWKIESEEMC